MELELSIKHITNDDALLLAQLADDKKWISQKDGKFEIQRKHESELIDVSVFQDGSEYIQFLIHYLLMAGYERLVLSPNGMILADVDLADTTDYA